MKIIPFASSLLRISVRYIAKDRGDTPVKIQCKRGSPFFWNFSETTTYTPLKQLCSGEFSCKLRLFHPCFPEGLETIPQELTLPPANEVECL